MLTILDRFVRPAEHAAAGRQKRGMLQFREDLIVQLIGSFSSRRRPGRPPSVEQDRLIPSLGHYPEFDEQRGRCVVCFAKGIAYVLVMKLFLGIPHKK